MTRNGTTQSRGFTYADAWGNLSARLYSETHPETGTTRYVYTGDGMLYSMQRNNQAPIYYTWDSNKRLVSLQQGITVLRSYTYDACPADSPTPNCPYALGRLTMIDHQQPQQNVRFKEYFSYTRPGAVEKKSFRYLKTEGGTTRTGDLTASYAWNGEGRMQSVQYPNIWNGSQVIADVGYGLGYDSMGRLAEMAAFGGGSVVNGVQYGPANELLQMTWLGRTEYRTYNSRLQMTRVRVTPYGTDSGMDIEYVYPGGTANNGRISQQKNGTWSLPTETLNFQYDAWNRLTYTSGPDFAQSMNYDGFGNLTARVGTGTAPSSSTPVNPANNQLSGVTYDLNGNEQRTGWVWDAENHLAAAGGKLFFYDSSARKVWEGVWNGSTWTSEKLHFYGADGRRMSSYTPVLNNVSVRPTPFLTTLRHRLSGGSRPRRPG